MSVTVLMAKKLHRILLEGASFKPQALKIGAVARMPGGEFVFEGVEGVGISPQNPNPFLNNLLLPGAPVQPRRFQLAVAGCPAPYIHRKEPPARLA